MRPVFSHGTLRLYVLHVLSEKPLHGYELIHSLTNRFGGTYSPSAGTIYPRLAKLEDEGLVSKRADGRKTVYHITETGRQEVTRRADEIADIETEMTDTIRRVANEVRSGVNSAMKSLRAELASASRDQSGSASEPEESHQFANATRSELRQAELTLNDFRQRARVALRKSSAAGTLESTDVDRLQAELERLIIEMS